MGLAYTFLVSVVCEARFILWLKKASENRLRVSVFSVQRCQNSWLCHLYFLHIAGVPRYADFVKQVVSCNRLLKHRPDAAVAFVAESWHNTQHLVSIWEFLGLAPYVNPYAAYAHYARKCPKPKALHLGSKHQNLLSQISTSSTTSSCHVS